MTDAQRAHQFVSFVVCPLVSLAGYGASAAWHASIGVTVWLGLVTMCCLVLWAVYAGMEGVKC